MWALDKGADSGQGPQELRETTQENGRVAEIGVGWRGLAGTEILLAAVPRACQPCLREVHTRAFLGQGSQHSYCLPSISLDVLEPGGGVEGWGETRGGKANGGTDKRNQGTRPSAPFIRTGFPQNRAVPTGGPADVCGEVGGGGKERNWQRTIVYLSPLFFTTA